MAKRIFLMLFFVVLFESVVLFMINLKMGRIFFVGTNNNINISSNCLKYNEEKIATLIKDPKNYDGYVFFCKNLISAIEEKKIPYYKLGYLLRNLTFTSSINNSIEIVVKTKGRLLDYESDNIIEITPNYKEKFKYKFTIRDANNNNIVFYYKPEDLSLVKFYRKTDTFLEEASFNSIKVGDQIEIIEVYDLSKGYILKKAEILKIL